MKHDDFLTDLKHLLSNSFVDFTKKSCEWQSRLAEVLTNLSLSHLLQDLRGLPLIELRTGKWVSLETDRAFFPGERNFSVPEGIEMHIVETKASGDPVRRQLYSKLGVADMENSMVQEEIVRVHKTWLTPPTISPSDFVAHAQFLFSTMWTNKSNSPIWVITERARAIKGNEVYIDIKGQHTASKVFAENRTAFNFLHPGYLAIEKDNYQSWVQWLLQNVGISKIPRLVVHRSPFTLSKDFKFIINSHPSEHWLHVLCAHWAEYERFLRTEETTDSTSRPDPADDPTDQQKLIAELSGTEVICRDKQKYRLDETFLPFEEFISAADGKGPLLRVKNPEDARWQNLGLLGVGVKNDVKFYMFWLSVLAGSDVKQSKVKNLLRQIQARYKEEDEEQVREFFLDPTRRLIFVPNPKPLKGKNLDRRIMPSLQQSQTSWQVIGSSRTQERKLPGQILASELASSSDATLHLEEAGDDEKIQKGSWHPVTRFLWSGPSYFRMNRSLDKLYPGNERLFRDILGLNKVNLSHFIEEAYSFDLNDPALSRPLDYMSNVISALDSYISSSAYCESPEYAERSAFYQGIRRLKMWPISTDPEQFPKELRTATDSDEWFHCRSVGMPEPSSAMAW